MYILYNAQIHTLDPTNPTASAIVIDHGLIRAIGDQRSILSQYDSSVDRINLEGRTVIPGLVDAHIHLQNYSLSLQRVDCETSTKVECLDNIAVRAKDTTRIWTSSWLYRRVEIKSLIMPSACPDAITWSRSAAEPTGMNSTSRL